MASRSSAAEPADRTEDRLLLSLKTRGPQTATDLGRRLGVTRMGARQHLLRLAEAGLVACDVERRPRGRPTQVWRLTEAARGRFPEGYAELTVELIGTLRATFGNDGLARLVSARTAAQVAAYRARMPQGAAPPGRRVAALAKIRAAEGYLAESSRAPDGAWLLVENHCPICVAAAACQGLCDGELELFRRVLGDDLVVERSEHLLAGARRCVYRIARRAPGDT